MDWFYQGNFKWWDVQARLIDRKRVEKDNVNENVFLFKVTLVSLK